MSKRHWNRWYLIQTILKHSIADNYWVETNLQAKKLGIVTSTIWEILVTSIVPCIYPISLVSNLNYLLNPQGTQTCKHC